MINMIRTKLVFILILQLSKYLTQHYKWRPPRLSELSPVIFQMELTHFGSEASMYCIFSGNNEKNNYKFA